MIKTYKELAVEIVREYGTENEIERLDAGLLSHERFEQIVADVLFDPILDLPIRRKFKDYVIKERAIRDGKATEKDEVRFEMVEVVDELNAYQWDTYKRIQKVMPNAQVKIFWVVITCGDYMKKRTVCSVEVELGERTRRLDVFLRPEPNDDDREGIAR